MTQQFIAAPSFWQIFPQAQLAVLILGNINNQGESSSAVKQLLADANIAAKKHLTAEQLSQNPAVAVWREAYQQFKTKKGVGSINPLVDIYNAASLTHGLPCGAEDIDTFAGSLKLHITQGGDEFYALGDDENSPTLAGELCYTDNAGAVCRCFNWRDGKRTMITPASRRAFIVLEYPNASRRADLEVALASIAQHAQAELGASVVRQAILTVDNPAIDLD